MKHVGIAALMIFGTLGCAHDRSGSAPTPSVETDPNALRSDYRQRVMAAIRAELIVPKTAAPPAEGAKPRVMLMVVLGRDGSLAQPPKILGDGSGDAAIDAEVLRAATAAKFPPVPDGVEAPFSVTQQLVF